MKSKSGAGNMHDSAMLGLRRRPVCWNCNEVGHVHQQCPKKTVKSSHGAAVVKEEFDEPSNEEGALVTLTSNNGAWLIDSGAFETPEKVHLGDGKVTETVGVGVPGQSSQTCHYVYNAQG